MTFPEGKVQQYLTLDEVDAASLAHSWIDAVIDERELRGKPGWEITNKDGVISLWHNNLPIAVATFLRDDWNNTIVTFAEVPPQPPRTSKDSSIP